VIALFRDREHARIKLAKKEEKLKSADIPSLMSMISSWSPFQGVASYWQK